MIPIKVSVAVWVSGVIWGGSYANTKARIVDMGARGAMTRAVAVNSWVTSADRGGGPSCIKTPGVGGQDPGDVTYLVGSGGDSS